MKLKWVLMLLTMFASIAAAYSPVLDQPDPVFSHEFSKSLPQQWTTRETVITTQTAHQATSAGSAYAPQSNTLAQTTLITTSRLPSPSVDTDSAANSTVLPGISPVNFQIIPTADGDSTGSISGIVTNGSIGIEGVWVFVYDFDNNYLNSASSVSDGTFTVTGLPTGEHRVYFGASGTGYTDEWFDDKADFDTADPVGVTASNNTSLTETVLELTGSISGRVTDGSAGLGSVEIVLCSRPAPTHWSCSLGFYWTDGNGDYTLTDLTPGEYRIGFKPGSNFVGEYYNNQTSFTNADTITVTSGADNNLNDAVLESTGSISGKVTDGSAGIFGVGIQVYKNSSAVFPFPDLVRTDQNGDYTVTGLPAGELRVEFLAEDAGYADEWYENKTSFTTADPVQVTALQETQLVTVVLQQVGSISGRVTDGTIGISGISVCVIDGENLYSTVSCSTTDPTGGYTVNGVPSGTYKVYFSGSAYIAEWYNDKIDFSTATPVTVDAPSDKQLADVVLDPALTGAGTISGKVTDGTIGIVGVEVWFHQYNGSWISYASDFTDGEGNYISPDLPVGNYSIQFVAPAGFANEYYDNAATIFNSTIVPVSAGQDIEINVELAPGSAIKGCVTDGNAPLSDANVYVKNVFGDIIGRDQTNMDGEYLIPGIPHGSYTVQFSGHFLSDYIQEWHDNKYLEIDADSVLVLPPVDTEINAALELGGSISGRVTNGGEAVFNATVQVYDSTSNMLKSVTSDIDGYYTLRGLPPGEHKVQFQATTYGGELKFFIEWYNNKADFQNATSIPVNSGINISNINADFGETTLPILTPILMLLL